MALIVEDGTGKPDAESYASVEQANDYFGKLAVTEWDALALNVKEASLRKATNFIQENYYGRWAGYRNEEFQALDWPRSYVPRDPSVQYPTFQAITSSVEGYFYPFNELPKELVQATILLALRASKGPLTEDVSRLTKREKVGDLEVEYQENVKSTTQYPEIERSLRRFFGSGTELNNTSSFSAKLSRT